MRIGYGFNRHDKDFEKWDCERVWIDTRKSERVHRSDMFIFLEGGAPGDDTLFLLSKGDLGYGKELKQLRDDLESLGVSVEYPPTPPDGRGRPAKFEPTPEVDALLRSMWKDPRHYSVALCLRTAVEKTGADVKRHQFIYRYGKRSKSGGIR
jgi:hypothetical protein